MEPIAREQPWQPELFGPYAERRLQELLGEPSSPRVAVRRDVHDTRQEDTDAVLRHAVGGPIDVWRRSDGKPTSRDATVAATHAQGYTLALVGDGRIGCDLQEVTPRHETRWRDLLGDTRLQLARQLADSTRSTLDVAATQIWASIECLKKAGLPLDVPLTLEETQPDGWTTLRCGTRRLVTCLTTLQGAPRPMALSLLAENSDASV
jgi:enediyne polyketide synthase